MPGRAVRNDIHAFYDAHERGKNLGNGGPSGEGNGQKEDALHAFFSWTDDEEGGPMVASFNPGCLRWQVRRSFYESYGGG